MRTQTLYEFRPAVTSSVAAIPKSAYVSGKLVSISESPAFSMATEESVDRDRDGLGCARGLRAAFFLEGGMVLLAYAAWYFWHFAR